MADALTSTASLDFDQNMWDLAAYYALRPQLHYDRLADVESNNAAPPRGTSVTFTTVSDLAAVSSPISETVDIDAVAMSDTQTAYTLAEYANSVITTFRARATGFIPLMPIVANVLGFNAGLSLDTVARNIVQAGTSVRYANSVAGRTSVTNDANGRLHANDVRRAHVDLVNANVPDFNGMYASIIHPDVSFDLRSETGAGAWRVPREYVDPSDIWSGETGMFEGFRFMESNRAPLFADASNGAGAGGLIDVYGTLFFGRQAICKGYNDAEGRGPYPNIILGEVVDKLKRFVPMSWHWYGLYGVFRQTALRRVESSSSIGTNT